MPTRRNKNTHNRNTFSNLRKNRLFNNHKRYKNRRKSKNQNRNICDNSSDNIETTTNNRIPKQYVLDANNNFILKNEHSIVNNMSNNTSHIPYRNKYSNMIKTMDLHCIRESSPKVFDYKNNSHKNWHHINNTLTDKFLFLTGKNDKFAGWTSIFYPKNNDNRKNNLVLSKTTTNAIHGYNNNVYSNPLKTNDYKFVLSESFKTWKLATKNSSQKTFHVLPNLENGHMFNSYYSIVPTKTTQTICQKPKKVVHITTEITSIKDILLLIDKYPLQPDIEYNINMNAIHNIKGPLQKLDNMIGMDMVKSSILDQILYYIQNFHTLGCSKNDFMHTVIYGPPGTGKTELAKYIGEIFSKLGVLKKNVFKKVTRSDLIAGYLGQTATKTRGVVESCLGGVLFIDEAYSLGNNEKGDSFSKECIDTLCEALSDHKETLMVIIAGYEKELKTCFFDYNQGLESRFTWRFQTSDYTYQELYHIFIKKVRDAEWSISKDKPIQLEWFNTNIKHFKYFGRNIETLFAKTKIAHSRRVFCKPKEDKTVLIHLDIVNGFKLYKNNDDSKNDKNNFGDAEHMYL